MNDDQNSDKTPALTDEVLRGCMQNRELSWLKFNERVLEEADSNDNPLFERLFFLSIFTSNLDEFYMIRVGGLCDHARNKTGVIDNKTGMSAADQLSLIYKATVRLYENRDAVCKKLESGLAAEGIERVSSRGAIHDKNHQKALDEHFKRQIKPLLAPQIVDQGYPFPHFENKSQIIALLLESKGGKSIFGMIPLPEDAERLFFFDNDRHILAEDIILEYSDAVFKNFKVSEKAIVSVTRNADIVAGDERFDEDEDFIDHMSKLLIKRKILSPVRLEVRGANCAKLVAYLQKKLSLTPAQTFFSESPLEMKFYSALRYKAPPQVRIKHCFSRYRLANVNNAGQNVRMLHRIRLGDMLLYHPYDSIQPLFSLIKEAASDKHVLSIQIALYRIAEQSRLMEYLITAAENGKEVIVFIELRARLDEENNIGWARRLEEAGCQVHYGPAGYKLHAKICLITRAEGSSTEYVTHIGTGNYNEKTARLYTDASIITTDEMIGRDASQFFINMRSGEHRDAGRYTLLWVAPDGFKPELLRRIEHEAKNGPLGRIIIKCNSLTDKDIITALIKASRAGVNIDLIVRGICCLTAQIPGFTENIRVRSVVGRFLEHSRIYRFGPDDCYNMFIGSGDMMTRNTERRIELFTPVLDPINRKRLSEMLYVILADNVKAREMDAEGRYNSVSALAAAPAAADMRAAKIDSQHYFLK